MRKIQTDFIPAFVATDRSPLYSVVTALSTHLGQDNSGIVIHCTAEEHTAMRNAKLFIVNFVDDSLLSNINGDINHTCVFMPIDRFDPRWKQYSNNGLDNTEPLYWLFLRSEGNIEDQILCEKSSSVGNQPFPDQDELFEE